MEDDEDCEDIYAVVEINKAIKRVKQRLETLSTFISNIEPYASVWVDFLTKARNYGSYLKIEVSQILYIDDNAMDEFEKALNIWHSLNEENLASFFRITCIPEVYEASSNELVAKENKDLKNYVFGYVIEPNALTSIFSEHY